MSVPYAAGAGHQGPQRMRAQVTGVCADGTAEVQDQLGKQRVVQADARPKGTAAPAVGETWVIVQQGGRWWLERMLRHPDAPVVTGSRADPDEALATLLEALSAAGLIDDQTTA